MADKTLTINVGARDTGVATVMRSMQNMMADTAARIKASGDAMGPIAPPRLEDFKDAAIKAFVDNAAAKMQRQADQHRIRMQAELVVDEANRQLFGDGARGPLRDTSGRSALAQSARDRRARDLRMQRAGRFIGDELGLTEADLMREANDRFRATKGAGAGGGAGGGGGPGGLAAIGQAFERVGKGVLIVEAGVKSIELASAGVELITARVNGGYAEQVASVEKMRSVIADIPVFGQRIVTLGETINRLTIDKVTGEGAYVAKLKEATAEQEKQIKRMEDRNRQRAQDNKNAADVAGRVGGEDPFQGEAQKLRDKIAADRAALAAALAPLKDKQGNLTETGKGIKAEGDERISNDVKRLVKLENDARIAAAADAARVQADSRERIRAADEQANQVELEMQGRHLEARLRQVELAAEKERDAVLKRFNAETAGLGGSEPAFKEAMKRYDDEIAAIERRSKVQADAARKEASDQERERLEELLKKKKKPSAKPDADVEPVLAALQESRFLSGYTSRANPVVSVTEKVVDATEEVAANQGTTNDILRQMLDRMQQGQGAPLFNA